MKPIFVILLLATAVALGTGAVAAQETTTENSTATPTPTGETDAETLDSRTTITGWEYDSGTFRIEIHAERPTVLTLTEAVQFSEGTGQMSIKRQPLTSGHSTVTISVKERAGNAAVVITSARSIEEGRGVFVSTGQTEQDRPPVKYGTAGLLAAAASLGTGWYSFKRGREKLQESDEPEIERRG